ncbi:MAG: exo-beta-N-acetylmuramidase NamZ domain-containing protein, partial [Sphingobacterium sp.]
MHKTAFYAWSNGLFMMKHTLLKLTFVVSLFSLASSCGYARRTVVLNETNAMDDVKGSVGTTIPGADQLSLYLPQLKGKKVGIMGNQTSIVGDDKKHLVDALLENKVDLKFAFAPEHGFRGNVERGEKFGNDID